MIQLYLSHRKERRFVTFGVNEKRRIIRQGNILLVYGLKHNLLSVSQLYDKGLKVIFESSHYIIKDIKNNKTIFISHRYENVFHNA